MIAATEDPDGGLSPSTPPFDTETVQLLLDRRPELTLDSSRPLADQLAKRLESMWLPDEPVIYIGKATSIGSRVNQYYKTSIGARSPHAGGWPLKLLPNLDELWVHWAKNLMPELAEQKALAAFVHNVSNGTRSRLLDPDHPYPYANLEGPGGRKRHGIRGARHPRMSERQTQTQELEPDPEQQRAAPISGDPGRTQRVTQADLNAGRIRVPRATKNIFPLRRSDVKIRLRSRDLTVRWDPRLGPPERSGTLGIGKAVLAALVEPNETLVVRKDAGRLVIE